MRIFILGLMLLLMGCQTVATPSSTPTRTSERTATPQIGVQFATLAPPTMAIVQITPSPLPTATATPTPTPVVYAVQGGDTLWSIALKNQTLPETIEALNVGLRPEALQIGQEIVLPPRPTALAADNVGTPIPVEIVVNSVQFYRTPTGGGWVLGEIENRGAFSAENIQLKIGLVDDQSQALGDVFAWSSAPLLPPNAKAPFAAQIPALAVDPASVSASIVSGKTVTALGTRYLNLAATDTTFAAENARIMLNTTISNSGVLTPTSFSVVTTLYDEVGNVNGVAQREIDAPLGGGGQVSFSAEITPLSPATRRVHVFVFGRLSGSKEPIDN